MWGRRHRHAGPAVGGERRARVEAEPADPQEAGADQGEDEVVRRHRLLAVAGALADHQAGDEAGDAGVDVDDGAAREVEHARVEEEAVRLPDPVRDRRVDDERPERHEDQHRRELHPVDEGADDEGRRDRGEGHLEHHEDGFGNGAREAVDADALEHHLIEPADEGGAVGKGEAVAGDHPDEAAHGDGGEDLAQDGEHVLLPDHAAVEQGETRHGHHQDECRRGDEPRRAAAVDGGHRSGRRVLREGGGGVKGCKQCP